MNRQILIGIAAIGLGAAGVVAVTRTSSYRSMATAAFVLDRNSNEEILIQGWDEEEIRKIIGDFSGLYHVQLDLRIELVSSRIWRVTFPQGCEPRLFLFLVNYLNYPKEFDLTRRTIGILGRATLSSAFPLPDSALDGQRATVYVPEGDRDYDVVYVHLASGETYEASFASSAWRRVGESRMPSTITSLSLLP